MWNTWREKSLPGEKFLTHELITALYHRRKGGGKVEERWRKGGGKMEERWKKWR